ncbi:hypothetical protein D3C77_588340 [compost metagenome]
MVRQLGQGLGPGDSHTNWNAGAAQYLATNPPAQLVQPSDAGQIREGLVDAVDLNGRHQGLDQAHDPLAHVPIQRVVGGERDDAVLLQLLLDLEIRLAHFHERLGVVAPGDDTAIVVRQDHDRDLGQVRAEHPLAGRIERVAVDQCKDRRVRHGCARCR